MDLQAFSALALDGDKWFQATFNLQNRRPIVFQRPYEHGGEDKISKDLSRNHTLVMQSTIIYFAS